MSFNNEKIIEIKLFIGSHGWVYEEFLCNKFLNFANKP